MGYSRKSDAHSENINMCQSLTIPKILLLKCHVLILINHDVANIHLGHSLQLVSAWSAR